MQGNSLKRAIAGLAAASAMGAVGVGDAFAQLTPQVDGARTAGALAGSVQGAAVNAKVPVRVLSEGNDQAARGPQENRSAAAGETAGGSTQGVVANVNAPIRVASDGDIRGGAGAQQNGSTANAETAALATEGVAANVRAPVRVLSDGDNQGGSGAQENRSAGNAETVAVSIQGLSANLDAPIRVLSDGDNEGGANGGQENRSAANAETGARATEGVAANVNAPVRVLSEGDGGRTPSQQNDSGAHGDTTAPSQGGSVNVNVPVTIGADDRARQDVVVPGSENQPRNDESPADHSGADGVPAADDGAALGASAPSVEAGETGRMGPTTTPSVPSVEAGVRPLALLTSNGRSRAVLGVTASGRELPLTGFPLWLVALLGLVLLASGLATLRRESASAVSTRAAMS